MLSRLKAECLLEKFIAHRTARNKMATLEWVPVSTSIQGGYTKHCYHTLMLFWYCGIGSCYYWALHNKILMKTTLKQVLNSHMSAILFFSISLDVTWTWFKVALPKLPCMFCSLVDCCYWAQLVANSYHDIGIPSLFWTLASNAWLDNKSTVLFHWQYFFFL